jgi:hypothetical protein
VLGRADPFQIIGGRGQASDDRCSLTPAKTTAWAMWLAGALGGRQKLAFEDGDGLPCDGFFRLIGLLLGF